MQNLGAFPMQLSNLVTSFKDYQRTTKIVERQMTGGCESLSRYILGES